MGAQSPSVLATDGHGFTRMKKQSQVCVSSTPDQEFSSSRNGQTLSGLTGRTSGLTQNQLLGAMPPPNEAHRMEQCWGENTPVNRGLLLRMGRTSVAGTRPYTRSLSLL